MSKKSLITHKTARYEYQLFDEYVAGVVLTGPEVKSVRLGHGSLNGSYVQIIDHEAYLVGAQINPYSFSDNKEYDPKRTRKLLLSKKEILKIESAKDQKGQVIVPLSLVAMGRHIKLICASGKGKKEYEKRAVIKERQEKRAAAEYLKKMR